MALFNCAADCTPVYKNNTNAIIQFYGVLVSVRASGVFLSQSKYRVLFLYWLRATYLKILTMTLFSAQATTNIANVIITWGLFLIFTMPQVLPVNKNRNHPK